MSFESVVKFSEKCKRDAGRIDVAIMNAGKASTKFELRWMGESNAGQRLIDGIFELLATFPTRYDFQKDSSEDR